MFNSTQQTFLFIGAFLGFIGVAFGAFGAHFLKQRLSADSLAIFEVGVRYHMYHVLALIFTALLLHYNQNSWTTWAGYSFISGILIFSGSLYLLVLTDVKKWGMITPIGGVFFLLGWLFIALSALKSAQ